MKIKIPSSQVNVTIWVNHIKLFLKSLNLDKNHHLLAVTIHAHAYLFIMSFILLQVYNESCKKTSRFKKTFRDKLFFIHLCGETKRDNKWTCMANEFHPTVRMNKLVSTCADFIDCKRIKTCRRYIWDVKQIFTTWVNKIMFHDHHVYTTLIISQYQSSPEQWNATFGGPSSTS